MIRGKNCHMTRNIRFRDGVIGGIEKVDIVDILPQLESSFTQRKTYFEFFFKETEIELTLEQLDTLSTEFKITMDYEDITIEL
jgi:hypothetical protein